MLLGYTLQDPPTVLRLLTNWRVELLFTPLAIGLAGVYLVAIRKLRRAGTSWSPLRTGAWLGGCVVLLLATSSGIGRYAAAMFDMHQLSHMLVAMLVPALFALGGPLSLIRAVRDAAEQPGRAVPTAGEIVERVAGSAV